MITFVLVNDGIDLSLMYLISSHFIGAEFFYIQMFLEAVLIGLSFLFS